MSSRSYACLTYPAWGDILIAAYYGCEDLDRFWGDDRIVSKHIISTEIDTQDHYTFLGRDLCLNGIHPMQSVLEELAIPFDSYWLPGYAYGAGRGVGRMVGDHLVCFERPAEEDMEDCEILVQRFLAQGQDAAIETLQTMAEDPVLRALPAQFIAPQPKQLDRIISLLCDPCSLDNGFSKVA